MPEEIKRAFQKVKEDIFYLGSEVSSLKLEIHELKNSIKILSGKLDFYSNRQTDRQTNTPTHPKITSTIPTRNTTHFETPTDNSYLYSPISKNNMISTGNDGVPTDRQTDRQTNQQMINKNFKQEEITKETISQKEPNNLIKAAEILDNLDSL